MTRRADILAALVAALAVPVALAAQGASTGGAVRLAQEQRFVGNWRRVLMIGAHPDDENNELLTILSRGMGMDVGYLSLTRGEGGQNLIGEELGTSLGVLRTEELLSARRIDGGRQFFTRAIDFGFSKTAEETFRFWNRDSLVKDVVRIIRRFRPQVIVSVWTGTPADGHGHHQVAGLVALDAFRAAGDSTRYPEMVREEALHPWQPAKFYDAPWAPDSTATLHFDGDVLDPATGMSLTELAELSRSQHRSQNQGALETLGPGGAALKLVDRIPSLTGADDSLFAGIPPEGAGAPDRMLAPGFVLTDFIPDSHRDAVELINAGVVLDATTDDDEVVPGQALTVTISAWNAGHDTISVVVNPLRRSNWNQRNDQCFESHTVAPGELFTCAYRETPSDAAVPTTPYFLREKNVGAMYGLGGDPRIWGEPFEPADLVASFSVRIGYANHTVHDDHEVQARFLDPVLGEVRRPVTLVPRVAVDLTPGQLLWPQGTRTHPFIVTLENLARDSSDVTVSLGVPPGWQTTPAQQVHLTAEGERAAVQFSVTAPVQLLAGEYAVHANVIRGRDTLAFGIYRVRYPHVRNRNIVTLAAATVVVADVRFRPVGTIGYVRGGGDRVPESLKNSGVPVKLLTGDDLERGSLAGFKVIVIGPRAYESDESLRRAHPRLMQWLAAGGTLVLLYEQTPWVAAGFPPVPLTIGPVPQDRVTDETAPVTLLARSNPVLRFPNPITATDFDGWRQERGLDFAHSWDAAWTPILEMHDPGEDPRQGGLLIARRGRGTVVYTGLAFNRQIPAAVPGAWRLFANILALGSAALAPGTRP